MKVLLHICCGICAGSVAERLLAEGHTVTGYFYNSNIHPSEEYERRLRVTRQVTDWLNIPLVVPDYTPDIWHRLTRELADEPEGGKRCEICFRLRLQTTADYASQHDFEAFTTTLTVSPHKPAVVVNRIGSELGGERFLARDFKKKDGFKRAQAISHQLDLYHQRYCGCVYSLQASQKQPNADAGGENAPA